MTEPTRIEAARGRAASAKELAVASAAAGFIAVLLLARAGHPGHSTSSSSSRQQLAVGEPVAVRVQRRRQLRLRLGLRRSLDRRRRDAGPDECLLSGVSSARWASTSSSAGQPTTSTPPSGASSTSSTASFSRFRAESELNRVNRDPSEVVVLSPLFAAALRTALGAAAATDGLVDPTLGGAIEAAGYDRDFAVLADDERPLGPAGAGPLAEAPPLGAPALAAARDRARPERRRQGARRRRCAGADRAATRFVVGGRRRRHARRGGRRASGRRLRCACSRGGVATSGTTKRRWRRGGEAQHHLIDPRTGRPARSRWDEVTVAAGSCVAADVAAKAAFLLSKDGPGLARRARPSRAASSPAARWSRTAPGARRCSSTNAPRDRRRGELHVVRRARGRDPRVRAALDVGRRSACCSPAARELERWPRFALEDVHRFVGLLAGSFIAIHVVALLFDSYLPFSLRSILVPGAAPYRPLAVGARRDRGRAARRARDHEPLPQAAPARASGGGRTTSTSPSGCSRSCTGSRPAPTRPRAWALAPLRRLGRRRRGPDGPARARRHAVGRRLGAAPLAGHGGGRHGRAGRRARARAAGPPHARPTIIPPWAFASGL